MIEQLSANTRVLLKFYLRNRLLLVAALLFFVIAAVTISSSLVYGSTAGRFEIISQAMSILNWFAFVLAAGLGLFAISAHLRQRSVKMIMTKPCLPEVWLASVLLSALTVSVVLHAFNILFGLGLSLVWSVPIQSGLFFLAARGFLDSAVALAYLCFLTLLMHPVLAIIVAILFNETTFHGLRYTLLTAIKTTGGNPLLPLLEKATYIVYMLLPTFSPYAEQTGGVQDSLRASSADWFALARSCGYSATAVGLFYLLSVWALKRRNLS